MDVLLSFVGAQRIGLISLLESTITPLTEEDWEEENIPTEFATLLKPLQSEQTSAFRLYCDLAVISL